jgi:hypothetical protein
MHPTPLRRENRTVNTDIPTDRPSTVSETTVRVRRAPKVPIFLILGGALGAIVTLALTLSQPADPAVGYASLIGYFMLFGIPAGIVFGALVALVLDLVSRKTAKTVDAELTTVDEAPLEGELDG